MLINFGGLFYMYSYPDLDHNVLADVMIVVSLVALVVAGIRGDKKTNKVR